jgi:hypothetical protein
MSENDRPMPTSPRPSIALVLCSLLMLAGCSTMLAMMIAMFWSPVAGMGNLILPFMLPLILLLAFGQYRATFRRRQQSAKVAGVCQMLFCCFWLFSFIVTTGELIQSSAVAEGTEPLIIFLSFALFSFLLGGMNLLWARRLKDDAQTLAASNVHHTPFSIGEAAVVLGFFVLTIVLTVYSVQTQLPKYAEHVDRDHAPSSLPVDATDISFTQGFRGTKAYEFSIDEDGFQRWFEQGIGSIESCAANIPLKPIEGGFSIRRYSGLTQKLNGPDFAHIDTGWYYTWSKEDRGVHAAYDSNTGRAYYYAHFH